MSHRNLTELFFMLRNNVLYSKNAYTDSKNLDNIALLDRNSAEDSSSDNEPSWIHKYEEAHFLLSKIKTRIDRHLDIQQSVSRSVLREASEDDYKIEEGTKDIFKLIGTCHGHIKSLNSSARTNNRLERILLQNIEKNFLFMLQTVTEKFRSSQTAHSSEKTSVDEKPTLFGNISTNVDTIGNNAVETFDNFLNLDMPSSNDHDDLLDEYFQLPASGMSNNQKQLMLIEAGNSKMIQSREREVTNIVNSIESLNVVFKDLAQLVQDQGTILDRIDYNIESTQTRVFEGYKQLSKAEKYQRRDKKIYCILILAGAIMFMVILLIFTKF